MSAESHQQQQRMRLQPSGGTATTMMGGSGGGGGVVRCIPAIVPPQAVSDRSILDSVAGFISDVTLQSQTPLGDAKDHILWVRFESTADISDPSLGDDWELEGGIAPPLLLILGYVTGVQVWIVPANGEAIEVLSWRHGSVKCLRVLPTPNSSVFESSLPDPYTHKRPLIALCDSGAGFASSVGGAPGVGGGPLGAAGAGTGGNLNQYTAVNFISLKDGETVRTIKFKCPIVDILANRASIVVTFAERIAVFDARTLDDRLTVTTCHPSPGINPNPVALGPRWIAYAERRLIPSKRSSGGCEGDGVTSYTATVLNAAKSLGKGLRELGEQVAAGLTGGGSGHHSSSSGHHSSATGGGGGGGGGGIGGGGGGNSSGLAGAMGGGHGHHHHHHLHAMGSAGGDAASGSGGGVVGAIALGIGGGSDGNQQAGVVTVLDIKYPIKDISPTTGTPIASNGNDPIVAHFVAHSEALVALAFDAPGMLLLTADRRGHDFHVFRLHPHPSGASLAAVHHLYVLHRGDTTAKVQDVAFSLDSRWVAVSTLRGTTHVFPVTPYGGPAGVRTHGSPHVVNRLSRFHRSAGLSIDAMRSSSPVSHTLAGGGGGGGGGSGSGGGGESGLFAHHTPTATAYANPRTPPFPHPTTVQPLAQLRQPATLAGTVGGGGGGGGGSSGAGGGAGKGSGGLQGLHHHHHHRQRNSSSSSSDDPSVKPLRVCATFAKARSWLLDPPGCTMRDTPAHRIQRKPVDSLFILAAHGALIQYDLEPKHASGTPKEKICDDTPIELEVEPKAQWCLQRQEVGLATGGDLQPPLSLDNWLIRDRLLEEGLGGSGAGAGGGEGGSLDYDRMLHHHGVGSEQHHPQPHPHQHPHHHQHRGSTGSIHIGGDHDDRWLSQVEIITHAGPHRRLWMGPQFMFKTYNTPSGSPLSSIDIDAVEVCTTGAGGGVAVPGCTSTIAGRPARSNPMNMPLVGGGCYEHSPRLMNMNEFRHHENLDTEFSSLGPVESQLREDLADAMRESPLTTTRDATVGQPHQHQQPTHHHHHHYHHHHQQQQQQQLMSASNNAAVATTVATTGLSSVSSCSSTSIYSSTHSLSSICDQQLQHLQNAPQCQPHQSEPPQQQQGRGGGQPCCHYQQQQQQLNQELGVSSRPNSAASGRNVLPAAGITIAKVVNPLGTVTTISTTATGAAGAALGGCSATGPDSLESDEFMQECDEMYLHENCDEALFRPVVTVHAAGLTVHEVADRRAGGPRYRGSSLDRVGASGLDDVGSVVGEVDYDKRPVSQPASLIGRDLIVPVIEEKNLPQRTTTTTSSSSNKQHQQQHQQHNRTTTTIGGSVEAGGSSNRKPQQAPAVVVEVATKSKDSGVRTKNNERSSRVRQGKGGTGDWTPVDSADASGSDGGSSKRGGKSCVSEEFVNVELPVVTGAVPGSEQRDILPGSAGRGEVPSTEKATGSDRATKGRKDGSGGTMARHTEDGRGTRTNGKRGGGKQQQESKGGRNRKHEPLQMLPSEDVAEAIAACAIALPPLEALKIDDSELFGEEDSDQPALVGDSGALRREEQDGAGVAGRAERTKSNYSRSGGMSEDVPAAPATTTIAGHEEFYDFGAKYEMMDFVEALPPLDDAQVMAPAKGTGTVPTGEAEERTLISFESPLQEMAPEGDGVERKKGNEQIISGDPEQQQDSPDQRHQVAEQMQNVLHGGNILLAMCSSLREGSPAVAVPTTTGTTKEQAYTANQEGLEYKSLEPQGSSVDGTEGTATQEPTTVAQSTDESEPSPIVTLESTDNGKRRRKYRKEPSSAAELTQPPTPPATTGEGGNREAEEGDEYEDDEEEEEDEEDEEEEEGEGATVARAEAEDEELQPLISSNKTSSSSLSGTTFGAQGKPEADCASSMTTAAATNRTRQQQQQQQQQQETCDDGEEDATAGPFSGGGSGGATEMLDTNSGSLVNARTSSPAQQSTALPSNIEAADTTPATSSTASKVGSGTSQQQQRAPLAPGGSGHGGFGSGNGNSSGGNGNGKKKSKKKRK
uniref:BCAS3 domain-containing protein n=1 Tax=Anopheles albimanus TaxID=7167 RepID=A0A182FK65_ANOAL